MGKRIDLDDYVPVRERIHAFYDRYPSGAIRTDMRTLEDGLVVFEARVYRDPEDERPTTGWAYERQGQGSPAARSVAEDSGPQRGSEHAENFVENCETSAIGRALANRDFAGTERPSREEMEKVQRMRTAA